MRKNKKRLLGLFGLSVVAIMFGVAVSIPEKKALAETKQVQDMLVVQVIGESPSVTIIGIEDEDTEISAQQNFTVTYDNVENVTITLEYTDEDGVKHTKIIDSIPSDGSSGEKSYSIDLREGEDGFGYGEYKIIVRGTDEDGIYDEKVVSFEYVPVQASIEKDENGDDYIHLDYVPDDGTDDSEGDVDKIIVIITDEDGNEIPGVPPIVVPAPQQDVPLPFGEDDLPSGKYIIKIIPYDRDDEPLYNPYEIPVTYDAEEEILVPDTGSFSRVLSFNKTDYLVSAVLVFGIAVASGLFIIMKPNNKNNKNRKNLKKTARRK